MTIPEVMELVRHYGATCAAYGQNVVAIPEMRDHLRELRAEIEAALNAVCERCYAAGQEDCK